MVRFVEGKVSLASEPRVDLRGSTMAGLCLNLSLVCQVLSAGFGKQAALSMPHYSPAAILSNHFYILSMLCLGVQSLCWPFALRRFSLSFSYLYMSASYVGILLLSAVWFREPVTRFNLIGAALIVLGVNLVVRGRGDAHPDAS